MEDVVRIRRRYGGNEWQGLPSVALNGRALLAQKLMEHAIIGACRDGEDSAGRAKLRELDPNEVAGKCCDTADAAFNIFEARGWLTETPELPDVE